MTSSYDDVRISDEQYSHISLAKLIGRPIADITVSVSREFADPVLEIHRVQFDDGTFLNLDGEHDIAYITVPYRHEDTFPQLEVESLGPLYNAQNDVEPDDEDYYDWEAAL